MTTLDGTTEDDLPTTEPISLPPLALDHFAEAQEAPTLPPPPVDEALAAAVAGMVLAVLGSQNKGIIDKLVHLTDAVTALTNQVFLLTDASHKERETATHRYDSAMARIVKLEDYRREQTGENDGSMSAAVAAIKGSGFPVAE